jgi:hypothetical protein
LTKTEEKDTIIINSSGRSTYPEQKSVSRSGATPVEEPAFLQLQFLRHHPIMNLSMTPGATPRFQESFWRITGLSMIVLAMVGTLTAAAGGSPNTAIPQSANASNPPPALSRPELCISLSGGGIRSGAVALGLLQEFYARDVLSRTNYVSSVSGGGFPVFGILAESTRKNATLKSLLSEDSAYVQEVKKGGGHFVDPKEEFSIILSASTQWLVGHVLDYASETTLSDLFHGRIGRRYTVHYGALTLDYGHKIASTFAPGVSGLSTTRLYEVKVPVGFPTPIIVGSFVRSRNYAFYNGFGDDPSTLFEFTPTWAGPIGSRYPAEFYRDLNLTDTIVASAAGVDETYDVHSADFQLPEWIKRIGVSLGISFYLPEDKDVYVSDGGFVENLGVLPLIDLSCQEIVALDATFDPDAKMSAWTHLSLIAAKAGWIVDDIRPIGPKANGVPSAWNLPSQLYESSYRARDDVGGSHPITILKLGLHVGEDYSPGIVSYRDTNWNDPNISWNSETGCNGRIELDQRCKFPMESTAQQMYTVSEFEGYRQLGVHLADGYIGRIREKYAAQH